jgi:PAS domain S-box-containing protein
MPLHADGSMAAEQLLELLTSLAESPDLAAAGTLLLEQLRNTVESAGGLVLMLDGARLIEIARSGIERQEMEPLALGTDDAGHPFVMSALTLHPVSSDGGCQTRLELPFSSWVALPFAQLQRRGLAGFLPEHKRRDLATGCSLHVPPSERNGRHGRAPAGVVVLETRRPAFEVIDGLDRPVTLAGTILSRLASEQSYRRSARELEQQVQRRRMAELLATNERDRLNLFLENVADPIIVTDDRSDIVFMNDQAGRLLTITEGAVIDSGRSAMAGENESKFASFVSDFALATSRVLRTQMRLTHPESGVEVLMEVAAGKIFNEHGDTTAIVSVLHDLTEQANNEQVFEALKHLNTELERRVAAATADLNAQNARLQWQSQEVEKANKLKSDFLASMSHELRTPINALLGYTSLMLDRIYGELTPGQEDGLNRIRASARHLLELISDILDLARIEAGKMPIHLSDVAVREVIGEVGRQIEPMMRKKGLLFESTVVGELLPMYTDGVKVRQILLNLLSNAVKFTPCGRVSLTSSAGADSVMFEVADTGIGIRAHDLASIWEDFRQLDQSRTREFGGTGLGLSITRRLVEQLGGQIDVRSEFGVGTTFTVVLPCRIVPGPDTEEVGTSGDYLAVDGRWGQQAETRTVDVRR